MEPPEIQRVQQLLSAKDDTSRFVGLLLLKSVLDNHASSLQHDQVVALWNAISSRFLDRLIRTGSRPAAGKRKEPGDMLDAAVAVIYTFTKLLNDCSINERFYSRIPNLANAVLYSSDETTQRIVELIHILVQQSDGQVTGGAACFAELDVSSWGPLIEIAPQHQDVFSIFQWAWVKGSAAVPPETMRAKIDEAMLLFLSSFKNHHPASLLDFITLIFDSLDPSLRPLSPQWLQPIANLIQDMASSKQTEDGRRAYTHCAAALLTAYPEKAPTTLFVDEPESPKPVAYLFVKMIQVDILSSLHVLIPKLNTPEYPPLSRRIAAALDIMTSFVGFLIAAAYDVIASTGLTPDRILKLHEDLVRAVGDIMEYLRDRWDAFLTDARGIDSAQASGTSIFEDPIIPAAVRFVATWLRDDDGEALRSQAAGLVDLFAELYKMNVTSEEMPELRLPILAALAGLLKTSDGREAFNNSGILLRALYPDLRAILADQQNELTAGDYMRGSAILEVFQILVEHDKNLRSQAGSTELLELVSKYKVEVIKDMPNETDRSRLDFQTDLLELAAMLLDASASSAPSTLQQKIKIALKDSVANAAKNWSVLDDKTMVARMAELKFE